MKAPLRRVETGSHVSDLEEGEAGSSLGGGGARAARGSGGNGIPKGRGRSGACDSAPSRGRKRLADDGVVPAPPNDEEAPLLQHLPVAGSAAAAAAAAADCSSPPSMTADGRGSIGVSGSTTDSLQARLKALLGKRPRRAHSSADTAAQTLDVPHPPQDLSEREASSAMRAPVAAHGSKIQIRQPPDKQATEDTALPGASCLLASKETSLPGASYLTSKERISVAGRLRALLPTGAAGKAVALPNATGTQSETSKEVISLLSSESIGSVGRR